MKKNITSSMRRKFILTVFGIILTGSFAGGIAANVAKPDSPALATATATNKTPASAVETPLYLTGFEEPLFAIGTPTSEETSALKEAFARYASQGNYAGLENLETFLTQHPNSAWRVGVQTNLGLAYYHNGAFSAAIHAWEDAWKLGRSATGVKAHAMVDRAYGELVRMHARIGHAERMAALLEEGKDRPLTGSATENVTGAKEGLWTMRNNPSVAYLCGPTALRSILASQHADAKKLSVIDQARSGIHGVSLAQIQELADKAAMNYQMVHREQDVPLPLPAVVHWKESHYAAVLSEANGQYHIKDPTFGGDLWVPKAVLEKESSGYFLIPKDKVGKGWRQVAMQEASKIYGMGWTSSNEDTCTKCQDAKSNDGSNQSYGGMPQYDVHSMLVSLNIVDTPVGYAPPIGSSVYSTITYNQREATQPGNFSFFNLGPKWTINWLSYIQDDPYNNSASVKRIVAGGGAINYTGYSVEISGTTAGEFAIEAESGARLVRVVSDSTSACSYPNAAVGDFVRCLKDGSKEVYGYSDGSTVFPRRTFLTKKIDPSGHVVSLNYETISDAPPAWNSADKDPYYDLSNSNKTVNFSRKVTAGNIGFMRANTRIEGKKYFEVVIDSNTTGGAGVGITGLGRTTTDSEYWYLGHSGNGVGYYNTTSQVNHNYAYYPGTASAFGAGSVIGVAVDQPNGKVWFSKDGNWIGDYYGNTGIPASGSNPALIFSGVGTAGMTVDRSIYPAISGWYNTTATVNFSGFSYAPPSGFSAITAPGLVRLVSVVDAVSNTTSFYYGEPSDPNPLLIKKITDPFGRHADFTYDTDGRLETITDAEEMVSTFHYGSTSPASTNFINKMSTLYGDTTFAYGETNNALQIRWLNATTPDGKTERTEYRHGNQSESSSISQVCNSPSSYGESCHDSLDAVPAGSPTGFTNSYIDERNTYYWDKLAYARYFKDQTPPDYTKAQIRHWLHRDGTSWTVAAGVLESVKHPLESRVWYTYAGQGSSLLTGAQELPNYIGRILDDSTTARTLLIRNALGKVICKVDPENTATKYTYADNMMDLLTVKQRTDNYGGTDFCSTAEGSNYITLETLTYYPHSTYSIDHLVHTRADGLGNTTTYTYNTAGQVLTMKNAAGQTTTYAYAGYTGSGTGSYLHTITDPNGVVIVTYTYDSIGRVRTTTNAAGYTLTFDYDNLNRLTKITYPDSTTVIYGYSKLDVVTVTDRYGAVRRMTYDAVRNQTQQTINSPAVWQSDYKYYENGTPKYVIDGADNVTAYVRDAQSRVVQVQRGAYSQFDLSVNPSLGDTDSDKQKTTYTYENRTSRLHSVTDAMGHTTTYTYDKTDRIKTVADANSHVTSYDYNNLGQLDTQTSPDSGVTKYTYYDNGNLATKTKAYNGATPGSDTLPISYTWDSLNRLTKINYPGTDQDVTYAYDLSEGCGTAYKGRLCRVIRGDADSLSATTTSITDYTYNDLGLVVLEKQYPKGSSGITLETNYDYDASGLLVSVQYPSGQIVSLPNNAGRITALKEGLLTAAGAELLTNVHYQPSGEITDWRTNSGSDFINKYIRTFGLNGRMETWGISNSGNGANRTRDLNYDDFGNISEIKNLSDSTRDEYYLYDAASRLTDVVAEYGHIQYSNFASDPENYDAVGNRRKLKWERLDPATSVWNEFYTEAYSIDAASNRLTAITRTQNGSTLRTRTFTYDDRGNIKTDSRQKAGGPLKSYGLNYGNSDRLNSISAP